MQRVQGKVDVILSGDTCGRSVGYDVIYACILPNRKSNHDIAPRSSMQCLRFGVKQKSSKANIFKMKKAAHCERDDATPQPGRRHNESQAVQILGSRSSAPVKATFDSNHLTIGAGVAIFHLASSCVILCRHSLKNYWFLPKGRRDAGEDTARGAEREGFEEVDSI